jgi:prepilin peptidase CpaA
MNMPWQSLLAYLPLLCLVAVAAWTDVRERRIPNWLTATVALAGLAQSLTPFSRITPLEALTGLGVGFALPFLLYAVGGRGAGDVKLLAGIGAWMGFRPVVWVFAAAAIVSLIVALVQCAAQGKLKALISNTSLMLLNLLNVRRLGTQHVIDTGKRYRSVDRPMPNAVNVLVATVVVVVWVARSSGGG